MSDSRDMVDKTLALLVALSSASSGASDLARSCDLPLSTAHRLLGALVRNGFAVLEPRTKTYALGLRVYQLAQTSARLMGISSVVNPMLEHMSAETREATLLAVRDGDRMLYTAFVQGPQQVRVVGQPGGNGPLHCTSQGKVLVAFAEPDTRRYLVEHLPLSKYGPNSITSRDRFREEIDRVRAAGYALADEEHEQGVRAISVPVMDNGVARAALSVAAPAFRMSLAQLEGHLERMRTVADELSAVIALGVSA